MPLLTKYPLDLYMIDKIQSKRMRRTTMPILTEYSDLRILDGGPRVNI